MESNARSLTCNWNLLAGNSHFKTLRQTRGRPQKQASRPLSPGLAGQVLKNINCATLCKQLTTAARRPPMLQSSPAVHKFERICAGTWTPSAPRSPPTALFHPQSKTDSWTTTKLRQHENRALRIRIQSDPASAAGEGMAETSMRNPRQILKQVRAAAQHLKDESATDANQHCPLSRRFRGPRYLARHTRRQSTSLSTRKLGRT
jgi:hypothetical protein